MSPSRGPWRDAYGYGSGHGYGHGYGSSHGYEYGHGQFGYGNGPGNGYGYGYADSREFHTSREARDALGYTAQEGYETYNSRRESSTGHRHAAPRYAQAGYSTYSTRGHGYGFGYGNGNGYGHDRSRSEGDYRHHHRAAAPTAEEEPARRRASPVYEDYAGPSSSPGPSDSQSRSYSHSHAHAHAHRFSSSSSSHEPHRRPQDERRESSSYYNYNNPNNSNRDRRADRRRSASPATTQGPPILRPPVLSSSPRPSSPRAPASASTSLRAASPPSVPNSPRALIPDPFRQRRTEPREEYTTTALHPPTRLSAPKDAHKLLVLDLNGSLLLRSAHQRRGYDVYAHSHSQSHPHYLRPLRAVHPRPYLPAFLEYLFHPATREWLDVMVWSSAQPHSVDDMVARCFGAQGKEGWRGYLKAVWARDMFGLSVDEYNKKTQTTKDLEKAWAALYASPSSPRLSSLQSSPRSPSPRSPSPRLASPSHPPLSSPLTSPSKPTSKPTPEPSNPTSSKPNSPSTSPSISAQTARSVILMDDSPLKARLQPWNHLCIPEYDVEMRRWDLEVAQAEAEAEALRGEAEGALKEAEEGGEEEAGEQGDMGMEVQGEQGEEEGEFETPLNSQERRRLKRLAKKAEGKALKARAKAKALAKAKAKEREDGEVVGDVGDTGDTGASQTQTQRRRRREYDQTLLAAIGVLEALKWQDNVAGWMYAGQLVHAALTHAEAGDGEDVIMRGEGDDVEGGEDAVGVGARGRDARTPPEVEPQGREKRRRVGGGARVRGEGERGEVEQATTGVPTSDPTSGSAPSLSKVKDDEVVKAHSEDPHPAPPHEDKPPPPLWYDRPDVLSYWVSRGREALRALGVEVRSGIER